MKKRARIMLIMIVAVAMLIPATGFAAGEIVDQSCEPSGAVSEFTTIKFYMPMGQSFIPTKSPLAGVEVYLYTANLGGDDTIALNLREGSIEGTILATSTQTLPQNTFGWQGWVYFGFPDAASVTPGGVYVWELVVTQSTFAYHGTNTTDQYAGGTLFLNGYQQANQDAYFRTYTYPDPSAPSILNQPTDQQALEGQTVLLTAAASGFPIPSVQWERSTDGEVFSPIDGAVASTYSFVVGTVDDNTNFRAVFTNDSDSIITGTATVRVTPKTDGKYYQKIQSDSPLTWVQAKRAASAMKVKVGAVTYIGHLATITSVDENNYVNSLLGTDQAFIGGTNSRKGWIWITGEPWDAEYWVTGEPSVGDSYVKSVGGLWDAVTKGDMLSTFLVEYEIKGTRY